MISDFDLQFRQFIYLSQNCCNRFEMGLTNGITQGSFFPDKVYTPDLQVQEGN